MGDAADDAFDSAMRAEAAREDFWAAVHAECDQPAPHPCNLEPLPDDDEHDCRCTVCGKKLMVEF
jgi:hypothetical protein